MKALCVVFDIDDTLYLERDYVFSGFAAIAPWARTWLRIEDFEERCRKTHESGTRGSVFNQVLESSGIEPTPELLTALITQYRTHVPGIELCDDAREALAGAATRWPVAVITDGPAVSQSRKSDALGLHRFASPVILTELAGQGCAKPSPICFRKVEQAHPSARYVYVADNPAKDFHAPQQLGWNTVRIRRPGGLHFTAENTAVIPDVELPDCKVLIPVLLNLH